MVVRIVVARARVTEEPSFLPVALTGPVGALYLGLFGLWSRAQYHKLNCFRMASILSASQSRSEQCT